jgi:hypothetical protein
MLDLVLVAMLRGPMVANLLSSPEAIFQQQQQQIQTLTLPDKDQPNEVYYELHTPGFDKPRLRYHANNVPLNPAKESPKVFGGVHWQFPWHTDGYARINSSDPSLAIRFRVFSQSHDVAALKDGKEITVRTARELLRLWEFNANRLKIDHAMDVHRQLVDVYLCDKGEPGGEQLFDNDDEGGRQIRVNTIYIYDLPSLNDNLEEAREVAHEYGHAVLPAIGGYKEPEYWANGYIGEKLFLRWLRDGIQAGWLDPGDAMGASLDDLNRFVTSTINPLIKEAAHREPSSPTYLGHTSSSMGALEGLVLYCDSILPTKMFGRSMMLINGTTALDYVNSAVLAAEEADYEPKIPDYVTGPIWLPVGDGRVVGGTVLRKDSGWMLVKPTGKLQVIAAVQN